MAATFGPVAPSCAICRPEPRWSLWKADDDWSRPAERDANAHAIPGVRTTTLAGSGHFSSLEKPHEIARLVVDGAAAPGTAQVLGMVDYGHSSGIYQVTLVGSGGRSLTSRGADRSVRRPGTSNRRSVSIG